MTPQSAAFIEDTEWLLRMDVAPWTIHGRVGCRDAQHLRKRLRHLGRGDLADRITQDPWTLRPARNAA